MKLPVFQPFATWNPTKLFAHKQCPLRAQLRYVLKLCPHCFKGSFGFNKPCNVCGLHPRKSDAQRRGIELDTFLERYLLRHRHYDRTPFPFEHPEVQAEAALLKDAAKLGGGVMVKAQISLGPDWKPLPQFTKGPWFWGELDVLRLLKTKAEVTDWKSGGINKRTGEPYPNEDYEMQLEIYGIAVLCAHTRVKEVESRLVFLDARQPHDPIVVGPKVTRKRLAKLQKKWEAMIKPMMSDTKFAPRPGEPYCGWCDYSKAKGGPCKY